MVRRNRLQPSGPPEDFFLRQILNIFWKDCQQFWPEILVSLAITAILVWVYPFQWELSANDTHLHISRFLDLHHLQILANVAAALLPLSWFFLTARIVHAENLIGTRQFWVTRPYIWWKLLAEKFGFLLVFVYLPFSVAQLALLGRAGFSPMHYLPGLLFNLLLLTGIVVLPFLSFAAVVSSLLRMFLVLLAIAAVIGIIAFFASSSTSESTSLQIPYDDRLSLPVALVFASVALMVQYSGRRLWLARALLITGILTVILVASNPLAPFMFEHYYPALASGQAPPFTSTPSAGSGTEILVAYSRPDKATIQVTVQIPSLQREQAISVDDSRIAVDGADGTRLVGVWHAEYNQRAIPGMANVTISTDVDRASLERIRKQPVTFHLELAVTELKADLGHQVLLRATGNFSVPGVGICNFMPPPDFGAANLSCRVPWHQPYLIHVSAPVSERPCSEGLSNDAARERFSDWTGALSEDPADFGLTSVWTTSISFVGTAMYTSRAPDGSKGHPDFICPGSPILLARYRAVRRYRYPFRFTVPNIPEPESSTGFIFQQ
jgi:hypothetical protein